MRRVDGAGDAAASRREDAAMRVVASRARASVREARQYLQRRRVERGEPAFPEAEGGAGRGVISEAAAAVYIQSHARGFLARKHATEERRERTRESAATLLQMRDAQEAHGTNARWQNYPPRPRARVRPMPAVPSAVQASAAAKVIDWLNAQPAPHEFEPLGDEGSEAEGARVMLPPRPRSASEALDASLRRGAGAEERVSGVVAREALQGFNLNVLDGSLGRTALDGGHKAAPAPAQEPMHAHDDVQGAPRSGAGMAGSSSRAPHALNRGPPRVGGAAEWKPAARASTAAAGTSRRTRAVVQQQHPAYAVRARAAAREKSQPSQLPSIASRPAWGGGGGRRAGARTSAGARGGVRPIARAVTAMGEAAGARGPARRQQSAPSRRAAKLGVAELFRQMDQAESGGGYLPERALDALHTGAVAHFGGVLHGATQRRRGAALAAREAEHNSLFARGLRH